MNFKPDPKPEKRRRKQIRIVNPSAIVAATLARPWCCACEGVGANGHHVLARGAPYLGDDVEANIVTLCGSGTMGCHGAWHGSPYVVESTRAIFVSATETIAQDVKQRRDTEWVARRIGLHIVEERPDTVAYVLGKLGDVAGRDYLARAYHAVVGEAA